MPIQCKVVERISKKGDKYLCLEIKLTDTVTKIVFLTPAEKEIITYQINKKNQ